MRSKGPGRQIFKGLQSPERGSANLLQISTVMPPDPLLQLMQDPFDRFMAFPLDNGGKLNTLSPQHNKFQRIFGVIYTAAAADGETG